MKKIFIFTLAFFATAYALQAQLAKVNKWQYASLTQVGLAHGSSDIDYTVQTIHGIQKNNLFAGIGVGIDNYGVPGFPLLAHLQKSFTKNGDKPFVYGQAGIQFPWKKGDWEAKDWNGDEQYTLHNGFIGEIGAGYKFGLGKTTRHGITFSVGYSYKYNKVDYRQPAWPLYSSSLPPEGYDEYNTEVQRFHYRRFVAKIGFWF